MVPLTATAYNQPLVDLVKKDGFVVAILLLAREQTQLLQQASDHVGAGTVHTDNDDGRNSGAHQDILNYWSSHSSSVNNPARIQKRGPLHEIFLAPLVLR